MQKSVGIISITEEGNISFSFQDFYIEIFGSRELKEIKSVKEYDKETGFIVLDTNYGEEFYCFEDTIEGLGLSNEIVVKDKLKNCDKWLIS